MRMHRLRALAITAAASLGLSMPQVALAQRFVVTCIHNLTDRNLSYSFQWGSSAWKKTAVAAKGSMSHWYPYDEENGTPPDLRVSFDSDPYTSGSQVKTYTLQRTFSPSDKCESGTQYNFRDTDNDELDLYIVPRAPAARPAGPLKYALACIENRTGFFVPYIVQWGNGEWKSWSLKAGHSNWHSGPYKGGEQVPAMRIKFDWDQESEGSQSRQYTLPTYTSSSQGCDGGKKYYFGKKSDGGFDLFDPEKTGQPIIGVDASPDR